VGAPLVVPGSPAMTTVGRSGLGLGTQPDEGRS